MFKALKFCIIALIILSIAWWVSGLSGNVSADVAGYQISTPTPVALLMVVLLVLLAIIFTRVLGGVRRGTTRLAGWRKNRRHMAGEAYLRRSFVALTAGDTRNSEVARHKAEALLGTTELGLWLGAEAARLEGRTEDAKLAFTHLTQTPDMKFLGHQGLLRQAMADKCWDEANLQANEAENAWPGGNWTKAQRLSLAVQQQNYPDALQLTQEAQERAALAIAASYQAPTPKLALNFARQAMKADANQPLAIATLAQALSKAGKQRAARKAILKGWKQNPHPLLAQSWFLANATPLERVKDATKLASVNPGHAESELLLAQASLEANLPGEARRHAQAAIAAGNSDGRAEIVLAKLDQHTPLPTKPAWQCNACQSEQDVWAPVCPICGKLGTLAATNHKP